MQTTAPASTETTASTLAAQQMTATTISSLALSLLATLATPPTSTVTSTSPSTSTSMTATSTSASDSSQQQQQQQPKTPTTPPQPIPPFLHSSSASSSQQQPHILWTPSPDKKGYKRKDTSMTPSSSSSLFVVSPSLDRQSLPFLRAQKKMRWTSLTQAPTTTTTSSFHSTASTSSSPSSSSSSSASASSSSASESGPRAISPTSTAADKGQQKTFDNSMLRFSSDIGLSGDTPTDSEKLVLETYLGVQRLPSTTEPEIKTINNILARMCQQENVDVNNVKMALFGPEAEILTSSHWMQICQTFAQRSASHTRPYYILEKPVGLSMVLWWCSSKSTFQTNYEAMQGFYLVDMDLNVYYFKKTMPWIKSIVEFFDTEEASISNGDFAVRGVLSTAYDANTDGVITPRWMLPMYTLQISKVLCKNDKLCSSSSTTNAIETQVKDMTLVVSVWRKAMSKLFTTQQVTPAFQIRAQTIFQLPEKCLNLVKTNYVRKDGSQTELIAAAAAASNSASSTQNHCIRFFLEHRNYGYMCHRNNGFVLVKKPELKLMEYNNMPLVLEWQPPSMLLRSTVNLRATFKLDTTTSTTSTMTVTTTTTANTSPHGYNVDLHCIATNDVKQAREMEYIKVGTIYMSKSKLAVIGGYVTSSSLIVVCAYHSKHHQWEILGVTPHPASIDTSSKVLSLVSFSNSQVTCEELVTRDSTTSSSFVNPSTTLATSLSSSATSLSSSATSLSSSATSLFSSTSQSN